MSVSLFSVLQINSFVSYFRFHTQVISYGICLSLFDLRHLVWSSLGPSMLLQMALFHSFLWLSNIPLDIYTHHIFFIHSSVDGHLDWKYSFLMSIYTYCYIYVYWLIFLWTLGRDLWKWIWQHMTLKLDEVVLIAQDFVGVKFSQFPRNFMFFMDT